MKFCQMLRCEQITKRDGYNESGKFDKNDKFGESDRFDKILPEVKIRANDLK